MGTQSFIDQHIRMIGLTMFLMVMLMGGAVQGAPNPQLQLVRYPNGAVVPAYPPELVLAKAQHFQSRIKAQLNSNQQNILNDILSARENYIQSFAKVQLPTVQEARRKIVLQAVDHYRAAQQKNEALVENLRKAERDYAKIYEKTLNVNERDHFHKLTSLITELSPQRSARLVSLRPVNPDIRRIGQVLLGLGVLGLA